MATRKSFFQKTIAIIYDFDGTLTSKPMQEYTVLPKLGITPSKFWREVKNEAKNTGSDEMLTYMRLLLEKIDLKKQRITKNNMKKLASNIEYYEGVRNWFDRINKYVKLNGLNEQGNIFIKVKHYIISAGMKEILDGIKIRKKFENIFASEYYYDHNNRAVFPKLFINDTQKTQFLFRINKGKEKISDSINESMPDEDRPIPFSNIIFIGDGMTDVPCMTVTKKNGGYSIAVHKPNSHKAIDVCKKLMKNNRIDFFAPADYSEGKKLDNRINLIIDVIISNIKYKYELFKCQKISN